eukprot:9117796-Pyramimonas_sp.AAC.1
MASTARLCTGLVPMRASNNGHLWFRQSRGRFVGGDPRRCRQKTIRIGSGIRCTAPTSGLRPVHLDGVGDDAAA